jgi:hypothetical protein
LSKKPHAPKDQKLLVDTLIEAPLSQAKASDLDFTQDAPYVFTTEQLNVLDSVFTQSLRRPLFVVGCHPQKPHRAPKRLECMGQFRMQELNVVVDQEATKIIRLQPVVKMHLVKIGSNDFLSQLMRLAA